MNALGCVLPNTPNATLTRMESRRSGRSKTKERDSSDRSAGSTLNHRIHTSAEPDILRATPEMESKMQHHHNHQKRHEDTTAVNSKRRITTDTTGS